MAENKSVAFTVEIGGVQRAITSVAELKKALKDAQTASLNGDGKAAKAIAELTDKMDDLKDATKTLQGSGVEKVSNSFGLLGEGLRNFDFDKIKTGFKGIGTAMAAIPVFLVAEGISYLIENWKELSEGNGVLAKTLQGVSWIFEKLTDEIYALTDAIGLTNSKLDEQGDAIKANAEKSAEALNAQNAEFDRQIKVAKAAGKSTVELEQAKQQAIIDTNVQVAKQIEAFVRAGGTLDDEKKKLLTASLNAIKDAKVTEYVMEQEQTKKVNEEYKKRADEKVKKEIEAGQRVKQALDNELARRFEIAKWEREEAEKEENERKKKAEEEAKIQADKDKADSERARLETERWKKVSDDKIAMQQQEATLALTTASNLASAMDNLNNAVFTVRMARVKKGSAEEEKLAKRQFQIGKALQLALAGIDAAKAITATLAAAPLFIGTAPNPAGIAGLAAAITNSAASIALIASKKYEPQGGGGDTSVPQISLGSGGGGATPTTQAPTTQAQPFTRLDEEGNVTGGSGMVKAYVVESEMSDKQKRVSKLETQAQFG
jgi:hypothetical protein